MKSKSFQSFAALVAVLGSMATSFAVQIVAHRGASFDAPENTVAAQRLAWEQRADAVETDIYLTKDGKIVAIHDKTYARTAGHPGAITSLTFDEARKLDAGSWKSATFAGEKLPSLDEQLALIPSGKGLFVEIKPGPELVPELARTLAAHPEATKAVTVISFNFDALVAVRQQIPQVPTQFLMGYKAPDPKVATAPQPPPIAEVIKRAKSAGFTGLDLQHTWPLTPDDVKAIRAAGLQLHVWTVDEVTIARRWIELGVDSITTNRPGWLREQLGL